MWAIWTARTWERARTAARSPHPYAQWMLWHGSEIKLRTLGRFCQRGSGRWGACVCVFHLFMWTWVFHKRTHAPWLSEVLVISLLSPLHTYVSVRLSICLSPSLSDSVYPLTACWPQSGKLRIHGTSQHFEKVQSCRPKRLREAVHTEASMWVSFIATITPVHPTLMLPACVCDHTWRRAGQHTGALELSGSATSSVLISGCSAVSVTCLWWLKAALKTIAPSQLLQMSLAPPPVSSQNVCGQRLSYVWYQDSYSEWQLLGYDWGIQHNMTP